MSIMVETEPKFYTVTTDLAALQEWCRAHGYKAEAELPPSHYPDGLVSISQGSGYGLSVIWANVDDVLVSRNGFISHADADDLADLEISI